MPSRTYSEMKNVKVACLYDPRTLIKAVKKQGLRLTPTANEDFLYMVLMKMGPALGQQIVQELVKEGKIDWSGEEFEVESIVDYGMESDVEFYLIKWKGWSHNYNTWEPKSNLHCPSLIKDYHAGLQKKHEKRYPDSSIEPETKKQKVEELMNHIFKYNSNLTPESLIDAWETSRTKNSHSKFRLLNSGKGFIHKVIGNQKMNKRSKAHKQHKGEVKRALKEWEEHLNAINSDPAKIVVENDVDLEGPPQNFKYINDYMPGQGVTIHTDPIIGCECEGCLSERNTCCAANAGMVFAYYSHKRVRLPPGYPIYECNKKCKCGLDCPNRVVQQGRKHKVCIFRTSNGSGWGVKTLQKIKKGSFVMEYVGEVITNEEAERRGKHYDAEGMTYLFDLDYQDPDCPFTVDAKEYGNVSHFVNHSCEPNLTVYGVWINNLDPRLPRIALFASKDIEKGEELTFDYMMTGEMSESMEQETNVESTEQGANVETSKESSNNTDLVKSSADGSVCGSADDASLLESNRENIAPNAVVCIENNNIPKEINDDVTVKIPNEMNGGLLDEDKKGEVVSLDCFTSLDCSTKSVDEMSILVTERMDTLDTSATAMPNIADDKIEKEASELSNKTDSVVDGTDDSTLNGEEEPAMFFRRSKFSSPSSKQRIACLCGAKKCRKFLY